MSDTDLQKAQKVLAIQDVYVCDISAWADRKYDPATPISASNLQLKMSPTNDCETVSYQPPQNGMHYMVRYIVGAGFRILRPTADLSNANLTRDDLIAEIEATFVVRYGVGSPDAPTAEMLSAFNENAVHHMWPYWRELLQATTIRLRVPPVVLPMRVVPSPSVVAPSVLRADTAK